jgi:hypothetical protein
VIAYRLATVQSADRAIVIDGGHVVGQGTHAALMQSSRLFQRLASLNLALKNGLYLRRKNSHFSRRSPQKTAIFTPQVFRHFPLPLTFEQVNPLAIEFFGQIPI